MLRHTSLHSIVFFFNITATPFNVPFNPCAAAFPFNPCVICRKKASGNGCFYCRTLRGKRNNMPWSSPRLNFITKSVLILFLPGTNLVPRVHGKNMSPGKEFRMPSQMKDTLSFFLSPLPHVQTPFSPPPHLDQICSITLVFQAAFNLQPTSRLTQNQGLAFGEPTPEIWLHQELPCPLWHP